eukprot:13797911-Alexandrium_andersonii.AAC.1
MPYRACRSRCHEAGHNEGLGRHVVKSPAVRLEAAGHAAAQNSPRRAVQSEREARHLLHHGPAKQTMGRCTTIASPANDGQMTRCRE